MIKIGINASFLRKQNTGIGQVTINFLKKFIEISNLAYRQAGLKSQIPNMEVILYLEEDVDFELPENFIKKVFLPVWKRDDLIRKILWEMFSLPAQIKKDECDVLLSLYQCPTVLRSLLRNKTKTKHLMIVHDIIPRIFPAYLNNWRKKVYQYLSERAIRRVDKIIAVSHRTEKDLIQHLEIEASKISVAYIDVDEIYKEKLSEESKSLMLEKYKLKPGYILNGGGLEVRKNTENVLRAYKILLESYGRASWLPKLVISGKLMPELAPLVCDAESLVKGLGLENDVVLLGYVQQEDLPALYHNASVFVYPSLYEGFGLPVLEAMNQAVPVITAKTSSLPEVGADCVLYCDPQDVDDLAMVIKNVLMNNHLQAALSIKGFERAKHFSWDKFIEKIINIIRQEVGNRN
ncbi:MAG: glycosyl transferase group 1 [uncultured bacterium]|nr:MAG: glycosyl transferase group 1 [uncultured bacterium]